MTDLAEAGGAEAAARKNLRDQAGYCRDLGSPFTALVCELLAARLDDATRFGRHILNWPGDARADALALRAAGAFNALARSGDAPMLSAAYPPAMVAADALWAALAAASVAHDAFLHNYLDSAPQTNEVRRSAVLLGGCLMIARQTGLPLDLLEIGASAGLNLGFDHFRYELGIGTWGGREAPVTIASEWRGAAPDLATPLSVAARQACDLNPLDPGSAADRARVLSYIWPDQSARVAATEAAFAFAAGQPWRVAPADAAAWVVARLDEPAPAGRVRVLMHTIMWQYLPEATKQAITAALARAGAAATVERPLAWLGMEADGGQPGAGVRLTLWPGGPAGVQERMIARADFHGRWVDWV